MKRITPLILLFMFFVVTATYSQKKSPPASAEGTIDGVEVKISYHQPSARGRTIMGELVPFGKVWRTGANNATTISFSGDVKVEGKKLAKGTYSLWTIPGKDEWTIIFNSEHKGVWGTNYPEGHDVLRVTADAGSTDDFVETFDISIEGEAVVLSWENTKVAFNVSK